MERYEFIRLDAARATRTPEGWIRDRPVLTRAGVFAYRNADGTMRREFRPPEEVFAAQHLASMQGVPITTAENHNRMLVADEDGAVIGAVLTPGERADGQSLDCVGEIVIHHPAKLGTRRELSLGYRIGRLDETPGEWQGQRYDAVQRDLSVNHCAVVPRGRAGNARLRLDAEDAVMGEAEQVIIERKDEADMADPASSFGVAIRLDGGLEYRASPEVAVAFNQRAERIAQLERDLAAASTRVDAASAERDTLRQQAQQHEAALAQARLDAAQQTRQRITLEETARRHGVADIRADMADRAIREAVIAKLNGVKTEGQSDEYVRFAFDAAVDAAEKAGDALNRQRAAVNGAAPQQQARADGHAVVVNPQATAGAGNVTIRNAKEARDFALRNGILV